MENYIGVKIVKAEPQEKNGVIKGYHALINWERTESQKAAALIELRVTPKKDTGFDEIAGRIMNFSEVESVYLMSGGFDLAVTVVGRTLRHFSYLMQDYNVRFPCIPLTYQNHH